MRILAQGGETEGWGGNLVMMGRAETQQENHMLFDCGVHECKSRMKLWVFGPLHCGSRRVVVSTLPLFIPWPPFTPPLSGPWAWLRSLCWGQERS